MRNVILHFLAIQITPLLIEPNTKTSKISFLPFSPISSPSLKIKMSPLLPHWLNQTHPKIGGHLDVGLFNPLFLDSKNLLAIFWLRFKKIWTKLSH